MSSGVRPRPPVSSGGAAQRAQRALDALGARRQRDHRGVVVELRPDPSQPDGQRRHHAVARARSPAARRRARPSAPPAPRLPRPRARGQAPVGRAHVASALARSSTSAPSSLLCSSAGAESLSASGAPSSSRARAASSSLTAHAPVDHRHTGAAQQLLGLVLGERSRVAVLPAGLAGHRGDLAQPHRVARLAAQRRRARQPGAQPGDRGYARLGEACGGVVVEQLGQGGGHHHRRAGSAARAGEDAVAHRAPGLVRSRRSRPAGWS